MSELSRKADQYWRSRTINEAQLQGYTALRLPWGCGQIPYYPFTLLLQRRSVARHNFIGNIRFRCKDCGGKDVAIAVPVSGFATETMSGHAPVRPASNSACRF